MPKDEKENTQLAFGEKTSIRIPSVRLDVGVLDGRHALAMKALNYVQNSCSLLLRSCGGYKPSHQRHGCFFENSGRLTLIVAIDRTRRRRLCFSCNFREFHRRAVCNPVMTCRVRQPYGIVRRNLIKIRGIEIAAFLELTFIPTVAHDPLSRLG